MSHDRGCFCGNERWDYRECFARKGDDCAKASIVRSWMEAEGEQTKASDHVNDRQPVAQVGGDHYAGEYQHWDWAIDTRLPPMEYAATKYISRWRKKNGVEDLLKARSYVEKLRETARTQPGWLAGCRDNRSATLREKYLKSTGVPEEDQFLVMLVDTVASESDVDAILDAIDKIVATAQGRADGQAAPAATAPPAGPGRGTLGQPSEQADGAGGQRAGPAAAGASTGSQQPPIHIYREPDQPQDRAFRCDIDEGPGHHGVGFSPAKALLEAAFAWCNYGDR